jgi:hypothetical protein
MEENWLCDNTAVLKSVGFRCFWEENNIAFLWHRHLPAKM